MKLSVYLETTIPSYLAARTSSNIVIAGRQAATHEFFELERQKYNLYVSDFVYSECEKGDPGVAKKRLDWLSGVEILPQTPDVKPLADVYMHLLSIPQKCRVDAMHLAMCCINGIDILLSWNCTHLGAESMKIVQKHNDAHGLPTPLMTTPDSLIDKYKEVDFSD